MKYLQRFYGSFVKAVNAQCGSDLAIPANVLKSCTQSLQYILYTYSLFQW